MLYHWAILASIDFPLNTPVVWGKCWFKKSVVSGNGIHSVGNVIKCTLNTDHFFKLLKTGCASSLCFILACKLVCSRSASKGLLCANNLSCSLQRTLAMFIFWISSYKGLFYETYQFIGEDFLAGRHNSLWISGKSIIWRKK